MHHVLAQIGGTAINGEVRRIRSKPSLSSSGPKPCGSNSGGCGGCDGGGRTNGPLVGSSSTASTLRGEVSGNKRVLSTVSIPVFMILGSSFWLKRPTP